MALELRQQLRLSQQLVMTPQLQQAIKLLQLSRVELIEVVQKELLENPLLEEAMPEVALEAESESRNKNDRLSEFKAEERELIKNADWEDYLGQFSSASKQSLAREVELPEEMQSLEARYATKPSLSGHLLWQLHLSDMTEKEMEIGEEIIGNLDSRGYLTATVEEIAGALGVQINQVEDVLRRIQRFDPVGVAARTPQECLLVQLEAYGETDPILISLVKDHLRDIEKRRITPLLKKFKISKELMKEYLEMIQRLDPYPGSSYGGEDVVYVSPDVFVYKYGDDFVIVLNDEGLPKLQLSPYYIGELNLSRGRKKSNISADEEYMLEKMRSAIWLMKSLHQRQSTLYKVMESILRFQRDFFEHGVSKLKPLILRDVAEDIGMHESTVSRITTNKYVATPHGVFELKFFFNSGLSTDDGSQVGSESIKEAIKKIIEAENPKKPLSDEAIARKLKEEIDVNIARRTVAKYRAALNIPSSSRRKKII